MSKESILAAIVNPIPSTPFGSSRMSYEWEGQLNPEMLAEYLEKLENRLTSITASYTPRRHNQIDQQNIAGTKSYSSIDGYEYSNGVFIIK